MKLQPSPAPARLSTFKQLACIFRFRTQVMTQAVEWNFRALFRNRKFSPAKLKFDSTDNAFNDKLVLGSLLFTKEKEQIK